MYLVCACDVIVNAYAWRELFVACCCVQGLSFSFDNLGAQHVWDYMSNMYYSAAWTPQLFWQFTFFLFEKPVGAADLESVRPEANGGAEHVRTVCMKVPRTVLASPRAATATPQQQARSIIGWSWGSQGHMGALPQGSCINRPDLLLRLTVGMQMIPPDLAHWKWNIIKTATKKF